MKFLEKDLEQIIFETPNKELYNRGLYIKGKKKRQLRIGNYGIADLVSYNKYQPPNTHEKVLQIYVWELKQQEININTFLQGIRYCRGIQSWIAQYQPELHYNLNLILVGSVLNCNNDFIYLTDLLVRTDLSDIEFDFSMYTYDYRYDGIHFNIEHGYKLRNEGF